MSDKSVASLQSLITMSVIPNLPITELLEIQNVLNCALTERIRSALNTADVDHSFELEINSIINYKSSGIPASSVVNFVNNFKMREFNPIFMYDQLAFVKTGDCTITLYCENAAPIIIHIYPTLDAITILGDKTIILAEANRMQLRGAEECIPFLSFLIHNLNVILLD